jgi:hypothetical protein
VHKASLEPLVPRSSSVSGSNHDQHQQLLADAGNQADGPISGRTS